MKKGLANEKRHDTFENNGIILSMSSIVFISLFLPDNHLKQKPFFSELPEYLSKVLVNLLKTANL